MSYTVRKLSPRLLSDLEKLFGANGACGGCWCQAWRIEKGERWPEIKGAKARSRLRKGVRNGSIRGMLAYDKSVPVGWCTFGPRHSFPRLNRAPSLRCGDPERVWSVPCFFVPRAYRGKGIASELLAGALKEMGRRGVEIAEGYPTKPGKDGKYISSFSWTGTQSMFKKAGFSIAGNPNGAKQRVRKFLS